MEVLEKIESLRWRLPRNFNDQLAESVYAESSAIAARYSRRSVGSRRARLQNALDGLLTSPWSGYPVMALVFAAVLWLTIAGANQPSQWLFWILLEKGHPYLRGLAEAVGLWPPLTGILVDGVYLATAWVVSVMLPPMAIFFPLFTILEDFGYLPRVAFNLDRVFEAAGAHGKQALTLSMGFGCNAAGVIAARVIDSPRERLIAILTNNFALCNGRWPLQIVLATIFIGALVPSGMATLVSTAAVFGVATLGIGLSFLASWILARTVLKGEASFLSLELPPFRPPSIWRTLYTSLIDRTIFVLWRAVLFAAPAGAVIWLICNIGAGGQPLAAWMVTALEPVAWPLGLTGIILLAYVVGIPANEIVIPTILMLTVLLVGKVSGDGYAGAGVLFETEDPNLLRSILAAGGWTLLTAVCTMLFSLCHNPCSTTLYTIYKETGSAKWTALAALLPLGFGFTLCASVAAIWRSLA